MYILIVEMIGLPYILYDFFTFKKCIVISELTE